MIQTRASTQFDNKKECPSKIKQSFFEKTNPLMYNSKILILAFEKISPLENSLNIPYPQERINPIPLVH